MGQKASSVRTSLSNQRRALMKRGLTETREDQSPLVVELGP